MTIFVQAMIFFAGHTIRRIIAVAALTAPACLLAFAALAQSVSVDSVEKKLDGLRGEKRAWALYELVNGYMRSDISKATAYITDVNRMGKQTTEPGVHAYLGLAKGVYFGRTGALDSAAYHLHAAKQNATSAKNNHALVRALAALGTNAVFEGKPENALEFMFEGLRLIEKFPDKEIEMKIYTNIAWAYLELQQYRNCIRQGLKNIRVMEGTEFESYAHYTYNNIAVCYGASGLLDSARYFIEKGISAATRNNDNQSLANACFILGNIYAEAGKFDLAIEQYLKARPYREKVGNPIFIVSDLYTISELYSKTGNYDKGIAAGLEALALAEKHKLQMKYDGTYLSLAQNYEGARDFRNASRYYRLWAIAKDTLYKHASANAIAEMQTRYETQKKEQQLALQDAQLAEQATRLRLTNLVVAALVVTLVFIVIIYFLLRSRRKKKRELYLREAQIHATIESQESERRRFAQDLHDGMGQLISALRLALHSIDQQTPLEQRIGVVSKAEQLLNDMHREIRSIAFNLMPQTLVQNGLIPALKEMGNRLNDSGKINIRVSSFEIPERLESLHEISLYRIIQEWVNNVVKYAGASVIEVQLVGFEDELTVTIEDDGTGFDVRVLESNAGNGWKNIRSRLNLIKASLDIDSQPGRKGTTLIIRIPLQPAAVIAGVPVEANTR